MSAPANERDDALRAAELLARRFHAEYERLAPQFGYETRAETRQFDPTSPNGRLMIAVCAALAPPALCDCKVDGVEALRLAREIVAVMGPSVPRSVTDTGARCEWGIALDLARELVAALAARHAPREASETGSAITGTHMCLHCGNPTTRLGAACRSCSARFDTMRTEA